MNTQLFVFMLFIAGLLSLYAVKLAPIRTPKHTPIKSKTYYEPRWEPNEPHGVWMGDKFFHALNPMVPGNPNWFDAELDGYGIYFEVDTEPYDVHWRVSSIEVMLQAHFIHVEAELVYGPNSESHMRVDYSVGLDEGQGWEVVARLIEGMVSTQKPPVHF